MTTEECPKEECPKEKCFFWICPGGAADMSGGIYQSLDESFKKGKWVGFPEGGCSCRHKCVRIHPDSKDDYYEPCD
jgi:hypothetical protein